MAIPVPSSEKVPAGSKLERERAHRQGSRWQRRLRGSRTGHRGDHDRGREHRSIRFSFLVFHYFGAQNGSPAFTS